MPICTERNFSCAEHIVVSLSVRSWCYPDEASSLVSHWACFTLTQLHSDATLDASSTRDAVFDQNLGPSLGLGRVSVTQRSNLHVIFWSDLRPH